MPLLPTAIAALPVPPTLSDTLDFDVRADAWTAALVSHTAELNAASANVYANAVLAEGFAAQSAAYAAAPMWVSGQAYALGAVAYSLTTGLVYRRLVAGSGVTDPSADAVNWRAASGTVTPTVVVTAAAVTALATTHYLLTNASLTTVTFPAAPSEGDAIRITVANDRLDNVIDFNGCNHMGLTYAGNPTMTIDRSFETLELRYINEFWRII